MNSETRKLKLSVVLETTLYRQQELADIFGKTQSWISKINKDYEDAVLIMRNNKVIGLEFTYRKSFKPVSKG